MKGFKIILFITVLLTVFGVLDAEAQCAMCKGAAEANLKSGGGDPKGLNAGILYMLVMPYLIVGGIGYWWWRNRKPEANESAMADEGAGEWQ
jgi:hypothetical protein